MDGGPKEARLNLYKGRYAEAESRYGNKANTVPAVRAYVQLAHQAGMSPTALAVRCSRIRPHWACSERLKCETLFCTPALPWLGWKVV